MMAMTFCWLSLVTMIGALLLAGVLRDAARHERRLVVEVRLALDQEVSEVAAGRALPLLAGSARSLRKLLTPLVSAAELGYR